MKLHRPLENAEGFSPETRWYANACSYITDSSNGKLSSYTPEEGCKRSPFSAASSAPSAASRPTRTAALSFRADES
jgi:hypothetical protein